MLFYSPRQILYNTCGPRKHGIDGKRAAGPVRSWELMKGAWVKVAARLFFPPPCPSLVFALELSRNITHTLSADPHIAHSCLNKRESEKWTLRQVERGILGVFDERESESQSTRLCAQLSSDPAGRVWAPHGEVIFGGVSISWAEYVTYFPAVVREWRRKQELGQSAREGERAVTVNMLLIAREPSVLLHKAPRQKGSAEPRGVDRSALCAKGHSCHCWSGTSNHIYFSCFFLNCYILKSLFCFCTRVRNFREHEEVSDWKTSIPLWGSNFFMTPG